MSVLTGDLETRTLNFATSTLDRNALFAFALKNATAHVGTYEGEKTGNLGEEVVNFFTATVAHDQLVGFAVRQLIETFNAHRESGDATFSSDLMKLGSSISLQYLRNDENQLVREFIGFLCELSETSGELPVEFPTHLAQLYKRTLCGYTVRALKDYCEEKNY